MSALPPKADIRDRRISIISHNPLNGVLKARNGRIAQTECTVFTLKLTEIRCSGDMWG